MRRRDFVRSATALGVAHLGATHAFAQTLHAQASVILGFTPGSGPDVVARLLARQLGGQLAASVIVEVPGR